MIMPEEEFKKLIPDYLQFSNTYFVAVINFEGNYGYVNDFYKNHFSFITNNFIGKSYKLTVYPSEEDICKKAVQECISNQDKVIKVELHKPGINYEDFNWISWEFSILKSNNEPVGIFCLGYNIIRENTEKDKKTHYVERVENFIDEITDGFYQLDKNWSIKRINKTAERILGIDKEHLIGKNIWEIFPESPEYNYPKSFRKAMEERITETFIDYRPDIDKWYSSTVYPFFDGINVFFRDITAEQKAIIALKNSENKLKAIFDSTTDCNILISREGKVLNFNKSAQECFLMYFDKSIAVDHDFASFLTNESLEIFLEAFPKSLNGETTTVEMQKHFNNEKFWYEVIYMPVYDDDKKLIGVAKNSKNINEKKQAELKIKEQDFMLNAIYNSTTEASSFIDRNYIIQYNNKIAREVTKAIFGKEAQVGDKSLDYFLPEYKEEFEEYYGQVLKGEYVSVEKFDGKDWWQMVMRPVLDENDEIIGIAHTVSNISEKKKNELKISTHIETLKNISWQQSHEIRKPVANILGICDLVKSFKNENPEILVKYIEILTQSSEELDSIIHKIVEQSKIFKD